MAITVLILLFSQECHKSVSFFQDCNTRTLRVPVPLSSDILHFPVHCSAGSCQKWQLAPSWLQFLEHKSHSYLCWPRVTSGAEVMGWDGNAAPAHESAAQGGSCLQVWAWTAVQQWPQVTHTWRHLTANKQLSKWLRSHLVLQNMSLFMSVQHHLIQDREEAPSQKNCNCTKKSTWLVGNPWSWGVPRE